MQCDIIATPKFKTQFTVFLRSKICMHLQPTCEYVTECIPSVLLNNRILIQVGAIIEVNSFLDSEWVSKYQATVSPCLNIVRNLDKCDFFFQPKYQIELTNMCQNFNLLSKFLWSIYFICWASISSALQWRNQFL